jgi:uncharacterized membrane protein YkoI
MRKSAALLSIAILGLATPALSKSVTGTPKISKEAATRTALAAVPGGKIETAELENEHNRLVWSFDIRVPGKSGIEEVQVSAITGKIVVHEHESPAKEAAEKVLDPN